MIRLILKCFCVFCGWQERKQAFKACFEKGRAKCRAEAVAAKWKRRKEQLEGSLAHE